MDDTELIVAAKDCRDRVLGEGNSAGMCAAVSMALCGYLSAFHDLQTTVITTNLTAMTVRLSTLARQQNFMG